MRPLKEFKEFLGLGVIEKRMPNLSRANSLLEEAEKRKKFLYKMSQKIGLSNENANYFIENSYDTLIELIRAKLFTDGFKSFGEGSHEAEISYMRKINFTENDTRFMNDLRYYRNGILYYGKSFDANYASKVLAFLKRIYPELIKILSEKEMKIRFCPKCKSTDVILELGGYTNKYKCKKCSYTGIFPEKIIKVKK